MTLDRLSIADLGGATIDADGALKPSERWLNVTVDAERLRDFALLLRRVAPGSLAQALLDRAGALSPAKLTFNARASGAATDGVFTPDTLAVRGVAGATRIAAKIDRAADTGKLLTTASLDAPETSTLLRQLGLQAPPATGLGRGAIAFRAEGDWCRGFDGEANASLAGSDLTWRGHALREDAAASGAVTLKSANVMPLLAAFGIVASETRASAGADLAADINWSGGQLRLSRLKGNVVGSNLSGDLAYQTSTPPADVPATPSAAPAEPPSQLQGALTIDHLSLGALASLALGPPQPVKPGQIWSDGQFAPVLANPPPTDVTLSIASLDLMSDLPAHNANIRLKIGPGGAVTLDDVALRAAGGSISGHATLRRDGATAALAGQIAFDSIALESAGLKARLTGSLDFAATGQNVPPPWSPALPARAAFHNLRTPNSVGSIRTP